MDMEFLSRFSKLQLAVGGVIIVLLLIGLGWLGYKGLQPSPRDFHVPLPGGQNDKDVLISIGGKIVDAMIAGQKAELVLQDAAGGPVLTLRVFEPASWEKLPDASRRAICFYVISLVPQARVLVSAFIPGGQSNPRYNEMAGLAQNKLCPTCWAVMGKDGFYYVTGDSVWTKLPDNSNTEAWSAMERRLAGK